jgi:hypothetical protein
MNVVRTPDAPADLEIPSDVGSDIPIYVVAGWRLKPEDRSDSGPIAFEQRIRLKLPDGKWAQRFDLRQSFELGDVQHRAVNKILGFPMGQEGDHTLVLFVREPDQRWRRVASYPVEVRHLVGDAEPPAGDGS